MSVGSLVPVTGQSDRSWYTLHPGSGSPSARCGSDPAETVEATDVISLGRSTVVVGAGGDVRFRQENHGTSCLQPFWPSNH